MLCRLCSGPAGAAAPTGDHWRQETLSLSKAKWSPCSGRLHQDPGTTGGRKFEFVNVVYQHAGPESNPPRGAFLKFLVICYDSIS